MKHLEMVISMSRRTNLGNYEHAERFASIKVGLETDDAVEAVARIVIQELREVLSIAAGNQT